jgi:hypothetical protein
MLQNISINKYMHLDIRKQRGHLYDTLTHFHINRLIGSEFVVETHISTDVI